MQGGLRFELEGVKICCGCSQLSLETPDIAGDVHSVQRQFLMTLCEVMAHFLHVVHQQHLLSSANVAVGLEVRPFLIEGEQQGLFQIQGETFRFHLFGHPRQILGHIRQRGRFVDRHQTHALWQRHLGTCHVHVVRQTDQLRLPNTSVGLNFPFECQDCTDLVTRDLCQGPLRPLTEHVKHR